MGDSIKIDVGSVLTYAEQRIRELLGEDPASLELAEWFNSLQGTALSQSSIVQCVGARAGSIRENLPADASATHGNELKEFLDTDRTPLQCLCSQNRLCRFVLERA